MKVRLASPGLVERWGHMLRDATLRAVERQRAQMTPVLRAHGAGWNTSIADAPPGVWPSSAWAAAVQAEVTPAARKVVAESLLVMKSVVKPSALWGMDDPTEKLVALVVDRVTQGGERLAASLLPKQKDAASLVAAGMNLSSIGDVLDGAADQLARISERAAGGVAAGAQTEIAVAADSNLDVTIEQEWATQGDDRVRPSHDEMEGQVQPVGSPFETGDGNLLMFPGDPDGPPEEVENCRCELFMVGSTEYLDVPAGANPEAISDALNDALDALGG